MEILPWIVFCFTYIMTLVICFDVSEGRSFIVTLWVSGIITNLVEAKMVLLNQFELMMPFGYLVLFVTCYFIYHKMED